MLTASLLNNQTHKGNKFDKSKVFSSQQSILSDVATKDGSYKSQEAVDSVAPADTSIMTENYPTAAIFYVISMAFSASQSIFGKALYNTQPTLSPF